MCLYLADSKFWAVFELNLCNIWMSAKGTFCATVNGWYLGDCTYYATFEHCGLGHAWCLNFRPLKLNLIWMFGCFAFVCLLLADFCLLVEPYFCVYGIFVTEEHYLCYIGLWAWRSASGNGGARIGGDFGAPVAKVRSIAVCSTAAIWAVLVWLGVCYEQPYDWSH